MGRFQLQRAALWVVTVRRLRGHAVGGVVAHGIISAAGNGAGNGTSGTMLFSHRLPAGRYRVCAAISTPSGGRPRSGVSA